MAKVPLTVACVDFLDRTRPLLEGEVGVEGCEVTAVPIQPTDVFRRVWRFNEFDCAEISLGLWMSMVGAGNEEFVGIPAFTARSFVAGHIFVNADAGIDEAKQLEGRRVGVPGFHTTGVIWIRGFLQDALGVNLSAIRWVTGGSRNPFHAERPPYLEIPGDDNVEIISDDADLGDLLERGAIDGWLGLGYPTGASDSTHVRRLFKDERGADIEYAHSTGILPILHTVVIRRDLYERHRWLARNVLDAFQSSKARGRDLLVRGGAYACMLPWLDHYLAELSELFGGGDFYPYGFAENQQGLETLFRYGVEQRVIPTELRPADLFAPETLDL